MTHKRELRMLFNDFNASLEKCLERNNKKQKST